MLVKTDVSFAALISVHINIMLVSKSANIQPTSNQRLHKPDPATTRIIDIYNYRYLHLSYFISDLSTLRQFFFLFHVMNTDTMLGPLNIIQYAAIMSAL